MQQDPTLLDRAKAMRKSPSPIEQRLWYELRAKRFGRIKFNRQVIIGPYIADFVCRSRKLVIELDGDTHAGNEVYDAQRTIWLEAKGYRVIRFTNQEVAFNLEGVLAAIGIACGAPLPNPLPEGERA
ncbi:MAG: hypothetical protein C0500_03060 [Sphingobium sp.]|nr:hypothetical protein [Sphingobium sp.]